MRICGLPRWCWWYRTDLPLQETWDPGVIARLGRSPGKGNDNPLQYSYLENPMDRGTWGLQSIGLQRVGHNWSDLQGRRQREYAHSEWEAERVWWHLGVWVWLYRMRLQSRKAWCLPLLICIPVLYPPLLSCVFVLFICKTGLNLWLVLGACFY